MKDDFWQECLDALRAAEAVARATPMEPSRREELAAALRRVGELAMRGRAIAADAEALLREAIPALCTNEPESALRLAVDAVVGLCRAERGIIAVREGERLEIVEARASQRRPLPEARRELSTTILGRVLDTGRPVRLADASQDDQFSAAESVSKLKLLSVLAVPFAVDDTVRGAIYLENRKLTEAFSDATQRLVEVFAQGVGRTVANARRVRALRRSVQALEEELGKRGRFENIVGRAANFLATLSAAARVAHSNLPVLIEGETGTGKELIARAIHANSARAAYPLVSLNCAALPETLLEDELFGHVKGAFTGAEKERRGLLASAHQGTLFLDEVAEMSPALQAKLLRVLEYGEYRPVGSDAPQRVDIRVVAAASKSLAGAVAEGKFREDLFYRLRGVRIPVPPLRDRREDIPLLLTHFLEEGRRELGLAAVTLSEEAKRILLTYDYPGNIRELRALAHRALVFAEAGVITTASLPPEVVAAEPGETLASGPATAPFLQRAKAAARAAAAERVERTFCLRALEEAGGNVSEAARRTGINRSQFQQMLARLGIRGRRR